MNEDESLRRFGLVPSAGDLDVVREILANNVEKERRCQGDADVELMRLCSAQLFTAGDLNDVVAIWRAKTSSMDADGAIDIQLLCGAGLEETKRYLSGIDSEEAKKALSRLSQCEAAGDFAGFAPQEYMDFLYDYYFNDNEDGIRP